MIVVLYCVRTVSVAAVVPDHLLPLKVIGLSGRRFQLYTSLSLSHILNVSDWKNVSWYLICNSKIESHPSNVGYLLFNWQPHFLVL